MRHPVLHFLMELILFCGEDYIHSTVLKVSSNLLMYFFLAMVAALSYCVGGVFMKFSAGFSQFVPSVLVYVLFLIGASLQTYITNAAHLGITYALVLGLEVVCTTLFSLLIFKEGYSISAMVGIFLIALGAAFLRAEPL